MFVRTGYSQLAFYIPQTFALALFSCGFKVSPREIENHEGKSNIKKKYHLPFPKSETSRINHSIDKDDFLPQYKNAIDNAIASQLPKWLAPTYI